MKSLIDYLIEAREYFNVDNITIDDIRVLTEYGASLRWGPNDKWLEVYNKIWPFKSLSPNSGWCLFTAYYTSKLGMKGKFTEEGAQKLLDILKRQPIDRLQRILGAGGQGLVYDMGDNKVMKMFLDIPKYQQQFIVKTMKKMKGKQFKTLPTIYRVTDWYYIREGVTPGTKSEKCEKLFNIITNFPTPHIYGVFGVILDDDMTSIDNYESKYGKINAEQKDALQWLIDCTRELRSLKIYLDRHFGDFKLDNLGETTDGRIIYHDWFSF